MNNVAWQVVYQSTRRALQAHPGRFTSGAVIVLAPTIVGAAEAGLAEMERRGLTDGNECAITRIERQWRKGEAHAEV